MRKSVLLVTLLLLFTVSSIGLSYTRPLLVGQNGISLSGHPIAAEAGMHILRQGGNAFDAVVAVAAVQAVVEPHATGVGGQGPIAIYDAAEGKVEMVHGYGAAAMAATIDMYPDRSTQLQGILSVTVPGVVGGWLELHKEKGSLPLSEVLAQAIDYAENGFPVGEFLAGLLRGAATWMPLYPSTAEIFMPDGKVLGVGDILVQKDLAETLKAIAAGGHDAFYKGETARKIHDFMEKEGGILTYDDMANYTAEWVEPLHIEYRGYDTYGFPLPTSAGTTLLILNILENFDLAGMGLDSADYWHTMAEAYKLGWEDRITYMADDNFVDVPMGTLLSKEYAKSRAELIDMNTSMVDVPFGDLDPQDGSTTQTTIIDKWGNIAAYTSSLYNFWGSRMVAEGTGIILNDAMGWLDADPNSINKIEGGKIPLCNMDPVIVLKDGKPFFATGTPGGPPILFTTAQMVVNAIDFQMNPQEAVEVPRLLYYPDENDPTKSRLSIEASVPEGVVEEMLARGQNISVFDDVFVLGGGGHLAIQVDLENGAYLGGADPRREGYGVAY